MNWEMTRDVSDQPSPYEEMLMREIGRYRDSQPIIVCPEGDEPFEVTPRELRKLHESGGLRDFYHLSLLSDDPTSFWNEFEDRKKRVREHALRQVDGLPDEQTIWYEEANYKGSFHSTTVKAWKEWYNNLDYARLESQSDVGGWRVVSNNPHFNPDIRFQEREMEAEGLPPHTSPELLARARALQQKLEDVLDAIRARPDFSHIHNLLVVTFPGEPAKRMDYEDLAAELLFMTVGDLLKRGIPQVRVLGLAKPLMEAVPFSSK